MYHDNASTNSELIALSPQTLYRGLYVRVARKLGVDASYVSRVARGERQSPEVEIALSQEIGHINKKLGAVDSVQKRTSGKQNGGRRLRFFVTKKRNSLREEWLQYIQSDPN